MDQRERTPCQVPNCPHGAIGFVTRGEVFVGLPQHPGHTGLCAAHLEEVQTVDLRRVNVRV